MRGHSRSKNGVAEPVIGPATSGRTRWLAYDPRIHADPTSLGGGRSANAAWIAGSSPAMMLGGD